MGDRPDGAYVARLTRDERLVLAQVAEQVIELLESEVGDVDTEPAGPFDTPFGEFEEPSDDEGVAVIMGVDEPVRAPVDSAVARLLPDAAPTEPEVAAEFRRLTQSDLARTKVRRMVDLIDRLVNAGDDDEEGAAGLFDPEDGTLGARHVVVPRDRAADVAGALTDLRLVLADRLDIADEEDNERLDEAVAAAWNGDPGDLDERVQVLGSVFVLSGYLQESLVELMLADLRRD